ncbi:hypothetical protein RIF29_18712 [Crotalaria pallida]|uniref:EXS domain-containing protein n=1 Tax=Crotalaria pallida TaxID=3830 RepID=A0AAN9EY37_CROPI
MMNFNGEGRSSMKILLAPEVELVGQENPLPPYSTLAPINGTLEREEKTVAIEEEREGEFSIFVDFLLERSCLRRRGLFTGCFFALMAGYVIMAHVTGLYRPQQHSVYMETVHPVLSMFNLMFLHFFFYGCNILAWRKTCINYSFIFELAAKDLKYQDIFLIYSMAMTTVVGVMFLHLTL